MSGWLSPRDGLETSLLGSTPRTCCLSGRSSRKTWLVNEAIESSHEERLCTAHVLMTAVSPESPLSADGVVGVSVVGAKTVKE